MALTDDMADSYEADALNNENYWDSEEREKNDREQDYDDDARLDAMSEVEQNALAEFEQLLHDDPIFAETWEGAFREWFEDVYLPTENEVD